MSDPPAALRGVGVGVLVAAAIALAGPGTGEAQEATEAEDLRVETNLPAAGYLDPDAAIELSLSRPLERGERVVVFIGDTDLTDLFRPTAEGLHYASGLLPLPSGSSDLVVHRVGRDGAWAEVGRFEMRVRIGRLGLETVRAAPTLEMGLEGQLAAEHDPPEAAPPRSTTHQDFSGQAAFEGAVGRGILDLRTRSSVIAVSHRPDALRFGELQGNAPKVDLADYRFDLELGDAGLAIGGVSAGRHPHLISGFASRGATFDLRPGSRVDLAVGALNGSRIVGWENIVGLNDGGHRILTGSLGLELLPRTGGLRLELTGMDGSVRPLAGFNQGVINDAEESRGLGLRVQASDPWNRGRLEAGWSRSRFTNPDDPFLDPADEIVPVERETRDARYVDARVDVLRDVALGGGRMLGLSLGYRHERVDPLYRSVAAFARADNLENRWDARATIAGVGLEMSHSRSEDNLNEIRTILKTNTRRTGLNAAVPLPSLLGTESTRALPMVGLGFDRTHQFGTAVRDLVGFEPSQIPDQVSLNLTASADWTFDRVSFGYRLNRSRQDNRQEGRETADFTNSVHGVQLGLDPLRSLSLQLSLDLERAENDELDEIEDTRRYGAGVSWSAFRGTMLMLNVSSTHSENDTRLSERDATQIDTQWSSFIPGLTAVGAQYVLRFSWARASLIDPTFEVDDLRESWSIDSGLNLSLF